MRWTWVAGVVLLMAGGLWLLAGRAAHEAGRMSSPAPVGAMDMPARASPTPEARPRRVSTLPGALARDVRFVDPRTGVSCGMLTDPARPRPTRYVAAAPGGMLAIDDGSVAFAELHAQACRR